MFDYLRERERNRVRSASGRTERALNTALARVAERRDARPRQRRARALRFEDTELETWFERDRAHVELRDKHTGQTIVEWWDDDVQQAIEDGYLPHRWTDAEAHQAAFDYAESIGLIAEARNAGGHAIARTRTRFS